ncbi:MAG: SusD/RagB family nutrient-binding outer membrane lipoprotein [Bacteroidales bacterium]
MKQLLTIFTAALFIFINTGCDKYLDVNHNVDAPDRIDAYLYLPGILSSYQNAYYDIRATGPLTQMMGTSGYTSFANNGYSAGSDAASQIWYMTYFEQGYNLENMINQAIADQAWTLAGIGYAIKAYSWDQLTKHQIDLPLTDAYVPGLLSHRYDYQNTVYEQVRSWAKEAISYLEKEDKFIYGNTLKNGDLLYDGDKAKWIKFAHGVIVRNLSSLSNKKDFTTKYAQELLDHAALALQTTADDATVKTLGQGAEAQFVTYNNFWGAYRGNLSNSYWQHDYAVQVFTGTVPAYDQTTGDKVKSGEDNEYRPYVLASKQIICDTLGKQPGHFDPRVVAKLASEDDPYYKNIGDEDSVKLRHYYGSGFTGTVGPIGTAPNFYGRTGVISNVTYDGTGRWLYRDDAPYILMTAAELKFCVAEAYWKMGRKGDAFIAWKDAVAKDVEFTAKYLTPGGYAGLSTDGKEVIGGSKPGGDKITKELFNKLASEYLSGPYVNKMSESEFTLSHIMMQKWVALYPWGAGEAWVDLRKYHYDIKYSGEYPAKGNGWEETTIDQKWDTDNSKVYKGFYLQPAQVENRRGKYNIINDGAPCYRIRPRYNSEYMWNVPSLEALTPIKGTADNYHCSIPWFAYPAEYPAN